MRQVLEFCCGGQVTGTAAVLVVLGLGARSGGLLVVLLVGDVGDIVLLVDIILVVVVESVSLVVM